MSSEEEVIKHESYGIIRLSQPSGGSQEFFGSPVNSKGSYISLEISPGEEIRKNGYSHFHGSQRKIIQVRMTHAQFVGMITSVSNGMGTPCTIEYRTDVDGKMHRIENPPHVAMATDRVKKEFEDKCINLDNKLADSYKNIDDILNKKTLSKADRDSIRASLRNISTNISSNIPWLLTMFHEASDKIVDHAKHEVDAFMNTYVRQLGMKALNAFKGTDKEITDGNEQDKDYSRRP